jgi:hypothetical protein
MSRAAPRPVTSPRTLVFADLSEVMPEVRRLLSGHRTLRNWTLAQVCRHLADTINASMDGFDLRRHRFKRCLFSRPLLAVTYRYGIPRGYTVDPKLTPPPDADMTQALADLEAAIRRYAAHRGEPQPHPLFGRLSRPGWDRLHCFHCAHHLRFVLPAPAAPQPARNGRDGGMDGA